MAQKYEQRRIPLRIITVIKEQIKLIDQLIEKNDNTQVLDYLHSCKKALVSNMERSIQQPVFQPDKIMIDRLRKMNMTHSQAKIISLFLNINTPLDVPFIIKTLGMLRTETYHNMSELQRKCVVMALPSRPIQYSLVGGFHVT